MPSHTTKKAAVAALIVFIALPALLAGCSLGLEGRIDKERLFLPLFDFKKSYLSLRLSGQDESTSLVIQFLDFAGNRIGLEVVHLPGEKAFWGWDLGRGAEYRGRNFYALKVQLVGADVKPLTYSFDPWAGGPLPRGLHDRPAP